jgi:TatD DNase family protein
MKNDTLKIPSIPKDTLLIDTHCHLDMIGDSRDLEKTVASAHSCGIEYIVTIGIDYKSSIKAVEIAQRFKNVSATIGIHPHDAESADRKVYEKLSLLTEQLENKIVGYGEIGLDYVKNYSPRDIQLKQFVYQLNLAKDLNLPVIIHDREAHEDTLRILRETAPFPAGGVMHCFSGDTELARQVLELDFHISIPGVVTFKNAAGLRNVVYEIPLDKLLLETDGPFLTPVPFRGKPNRPEYLIYTALKVAEIRDIPFSEVAEATTKNAKQLFCLVQ